MHPMWCFFVGRRPQEPFRVEDRPWRSGLERDKHTLYLAARSSNTVGATQSISSSDVDIHDMPGPRVDGASWCCCWRAPYPVLVLSRRNTRSPGGCIRCKRVGHPRTGPRGMLPSAWERRASGGGHAILSPRFAHPQTGDGEGQSSPFGHDIECMLACRLLLHYLESNPYISP